MKLAHNIRFTTISHDPEERELLLQAFQEHLGFDCTKLAEHETLTHPGLEPLYTCKLWLDTQPRIRAAITLLRQLPDADKNALQERAELHLDERLRFSFRLDKIAFLNGKIEKKDRGDVIQVRITPAAYPKNAENALAIIQELFTTNV